MKIKVGQLRCLIEQQLGQMKLGIAGGESDSRNWGRKPEKDVVEVEPEKGGPTYIATDFPDYDPGEEIKALYRGRGGRDMAGDPIGSGVRSVADVGDEDVITVDDDEVEFGVPDGLRDLTRRAEGLVREDYMEQPDPFAEPKQKPDLKKMGNAVLKAEQILGDVPGVLDALAEEMSDPRAKDYVKKGAGLAHHALNDLKALEALLTVALKRHRKN